jgi:hypothetical protein
MQMLYDSDTFVVVHQKINDPFGAVPHDPFEKPKHGFEIVDKRTNKEVFLAGPWADAFQQQIDAWQLKTPLQEEVEETLDQYSALAHYPLVIH